MRVTTAPATPYHSRLPHAHKARAFAIGLVIVLILSLRNPRAWGEPVWAALTFALLPALVAFAVGRTTPPREGITNAFWITNFLVFWYTAIGMMRTHHRVGSGGDPGQTALVGLFVAVVDAALAGLVAAGVSALWHRRGEKS